MTKIFAGQLWVSLGERCADTGQNMDIADTQSSVNTTVWPRWVTATQTGKDCSSYQIDDRTRNTRLYQITINSPSADG